MLAVRGDVGGVSACSRPAVTQSCLYPQPAQASWLLPRLQQRASVRLAANVLTAAVLRSG